MVDKPPGLLSADVTGGGEPNVFDWLKERYQRRRNRGGRVYIIHRLDKDASGLLVFALSPKGFSWLKDDFRAKRVHRLYLGVAEGVPGEQATKSGAVESAKGGASPNPGRRRPLQLPMGIVQTFLKEGIDGAMRVVPIGEAATSRRDMPDLDDDDARLAITHYRVLASGRGFSLVQFRLETGRRNQIRVHMQHLGHPLVGDRLYGATTDPIGRLGLHAVELGFRHPGTGESVRFRSEPPPSFSKAIGRAPMAPMEPESALSPEASTRPIEDAPAQSELASAPMPIDTAASPDTTRVGSLPPPGRPKTAKPGDSPATSWDHVAAWYDRLIGEKLTDHYERVILPGTLRLLDMQPGHRLLDVACGQGVLCRLLAARGIECVGIDASPRLIEAAKRLETDPAYRATTAHIAPKYAAGDARDLATPLAALGETARFDAASCVMAIMNIDPLEPMLAGIASHLRPGGVLAIVMLHPAFRAPAQTSWGWESEPEGRARPQSRARDGRGKRDKPPAVRQFRRIDGYLSSGAVPIVMNPGKVASGGTPVQTWTFHRPLQAYSKALQEAGFLIESIEEWPSVRTSEPGPRATEENRVRREIPMFVGLRARLMPGTLA